MMGPSKNLPIVNPATNPPPVNPPPVNPPAANPAPANPAPTNAAELFSEMPAIPPSAISLNGMNQKQLFALYEKMSRKLSHVRTLRNATLVERDALEGYVSVVAEELERTRAHINNVQAQTERIAETHRNEIRMYMQKVVHLQYEHEKNVETEEKMANEQIEEHEKQHEVYKTQMHDQVDEVKEAIRKEERQCEEEIRRLKEVQGKELMKLREQFERFEAEMRQGYEGRYKELQEELELRRKMELHEISERKNRHIQDLMKQHNHAYEAMRSYYNNITQDNLALIRELNNEITELKAAHKHNEKQHMKIERKNAALKRPLEEAEEKLRALQRKLINFQKDKDSLRHQKNRLAALEMQLMKRKEEKAAQIAHFQRVQDERDTLLKTFEGTVQAVQEKTQSHNVMLERSIEELMATFQAKKTQLSSLLKVSKADPAVLRDITGKLDAVLDSKNAQINELEFELAKVNKTHADMIKVYEAKMRELGVPTADLHLAETLKASAFRLSAPADLLTE